MAAIDNTHAAPARAGDARRPRERSPIAAPRPRREQVRHAMPRTVDDPLAARLMRAVRERADRLPAGGGAIGPQAAGPLLTQADAGLIQRVLIGGIEVNKQTSMPQWEQDGLTYHINLKTGEFHITQEGRSQGKKKKGEKTKTHFFFQYDITPRGYVFKNKASAQKGKKMWSALPGDVRTFVETNWVALTS